MKKFFVLFLVSLVLVVAISGMVLAEKITVGVWPPMDSSFSALVPKFNEIYPDIEVEIKSLGFNDHFDMLTTALAAGSGAPDVAGIEIGFIAKYVAEGGFVNLLEEPYNAGRYKEGVMDANWAQASTRDGRLIAMPVDIAPACAYYRPAQFTAEGIDVEKDIKSIEDLFEAGLKVTKDTDGDGEIDQWLIPNAADIAWMIIRSDNRLFFDEEGNSLVDSPRFIKAFKWAKLFRENGLDAEVGTWTNEWYEVLDSGKVVYQPSGAWLGGHLKNWMDTDGAGHWRVARFPALEPGGEPMDCNWGGSFLGIPQQSKHKEAAWKFIEFVTTNVDAQISSYKIGDAFPSWKEAWDHPMFEEPNEYLGGQKARLLWRDIAQGIPSVVTHKFDSVAEDIVSDALARVLDEGIEVETALREAKERIERRVARDR